MRPHQIYHVRKNEKRTTFLLAESGEGPFLYVEGDCGVWPREPIEFCSDHGMEKRQYAVFKRIDALVDVFDVDIALFIA